jgi:hypothetical protein
MMRNLVTCIALGLMGIGSPVSAKEPCPPSKYPPPYPWLITDMMSGDQFADIYLDIDKAGKPINCRMGKNNIPGDNKFFVCQAFIGQWMTSPQPNDPEVGPPPPNTPKGSPIKATVHRHFVAYGDKHAKAEREARERFFQQHPEERRDCYPTGDEL